MTVVGWSGTSKISWSQFKEVDSAPADTGEDIAETIASTKYDIGPDGVVITIKLSTASWVVKGKQNAVLLKHEQGHWDIAGLYAYEANRKLKGLTPEDASSMFTSVMSDCQTVQDQYDTETDHGRIASKQTEWNEKIALEIRKGYGLITP